MEHITIFVDASVGAELHRAMGIAMLTFRAGKVIEIDCDTRPFLTSSNCAEAWGVFSAIRKAVTYLNSTQKSYVVIRCDNSHVMHYTQLALGGDVWQRHTLHKKYGDAVPPTTAELIEWSALFSQKRLQFKHLPRTNNFIAVCDRVANWAYTDIRPNKHPNSGIGIRLAHLMASRGLQWGLKQSRKDAIQKLLLVNQKARTSRRRKFFGQSASEPEVISFDYLVDRIIERQLSVAFS